ncbi:transmembrane protein [Rhynchospora pubera]|uniref:Transmembrane protein n=1 Tax=Rhynchospora pubera TaxID=906938 RepID=A0AAV8DJC5_9POAL|nr:transmembrane protein [Rhynchospora pubera]
MAEQRSPVSKSSSCRGVSFEIKPSQENLFNVKPSFNNQPNNSSGRWVWMPWSHPDPSKVFPFSAALEKSFSRQSSHFCDLTEEEEEEEEIMVDIEIQNTEKTSIPEPIKRTISLRKTVKPKQSRLSVILLDQGLFTVYKRLFAICFILNIVALVLAATNHFAYAKKRAALFSIANILALTLCRSEALLRVVFYFSVKLLGRSWVPLPIKTAVTAILQSLGGVHSGCGVSAVAWLIYALVQTLSNSDQTSPEIIAVASAILALLCASCLAAFPLVRHLHHNVFERTHRCAGWMALALLWVFIVLTNGYNPANKSYDKLKFSSLIKLQEFWLTITITFFTILPWVTVKKVPVKATAPSGHASLITFTGGIKAGLLGRISRSPLSEWHAFGIISDNKDTHLMLAGAVGDFTKGLVSDPPRHLWVRGVHFAGLPYLVNMYQRVVLVATGSGICVFLSFLLQPCKAEVCLVWVARGVEENFGKEIKEMVTGSRNGKVVVHDTATMGRPNVAEMTVDAARDWKAEVVVVTSNPEGSRDVVEACKKAGIAAFGPIWDS